MSDQPTNPVAEPTAQRVAEPVATPTPEGTPPVVPRREESESLFPISGSWMVATAASVAMVLLALLGVGLTTANAAVAPTYWVCLVPLFGAGCVAIAWARARHHSMLAWPAVTRQVLHWAGIAIALWIDFLIRGTGVESGTAAGMNALLLLALGCFLAGVHLEWMFALVGVLLTVALIIVTKADEYLWLIFVIGAVTIAVMIALRWVLVRIARSRAAGSTVVVTGS
jgi:hypothetical protein